MSEAKNHLVEDENLHPNLVEDEEGAVFVEYVVLVSTVTIGMMTSIAAMGIPLVKLYDLTRSMLLFPLP